MKDKIFLLSVDEYERYYDKIPKYDADDKDYEYRWWLRTPYKKNFASSSSRAFYVDSDYGYVNISLVVYSFAVRPALNLNGLSSENDEFEYLGIKWIKLSNRLAIAKEPIFNSVFDYNRQDYEHSDIRKKLLAWYKQKTT